MSYTTYNMFAKFKAIYPMFAGTSFSHSINLCNPALNTITWEGSPTHDGNGVSFNGINQSGDTNCLLPATFDRCAAIHIRGGTSWTNGCFDGMYVFGMQHNGIDGTSAGGRNDLGPMNAPPAPFWAVDVSGGAPGEGKLFRSGILEDTVLANAGPNAMTLCIGKLKGYTSYSEGLIKFYSISQSLSSAEHLLLNNAVIAYQTSLGRA